MDGIGTFIWDDNDVLIVGCTDEVFNLVCILMVASGVDGDEMRALLLE